MQLNIVIMFRTTCSENKEEGLLTLPGKVGEAPQRRWHLNWVLKISEGSIVVKSRRSKKCVKRVGGGWG